MFDGGAKWRLSRIFSPTHAPAGGFPPKVYSSLPPASLKGERLQPELSRVQPSLNSQGQEFCQEAAQPNSRMKSSPG